MVRVLIALFAFGSHDVARPSEVFIAAMRFLVCPPIEVKNPPAYNMPLVESIAKAETILFEFGFHDVARPSEVFMAAIRFLACPPAPVKFPPTYRILFVESN